MFLDEPDSESLEKYQYRLVILTTGPGIGPPGIQLTLAPWGVDELIEYMLATNHSACSSVIGRLRSVARLSWAPEVACVVADRMAADESVGDPVRALVAHIHHELPTSKQRKAAAQYCLSLLVKGSADIDAFVKILKIGCSEKARKLMRHELVQLPLATEHVLKRLSRGRYEVIERSLPVKLLEVLGKFSRDDAAVRSQLRRFIDSPKAVAAHPMAASILFLAEPKWRPEPRRDGWNFAGGHFPQAAWAGVDLQAADLSGSDLSESDLNAANLEKCVASNASFERAQLRSAKLMRIEAVQTRFRAAVLTEAKLSAGRLQRADFSNSDLTDAAIMLTDLSGADFTAAKLVRADLTKAQLTGAKLEDADLSGATLNGATLRGVDLRTVRLAGVKLIGADLVGAQMEDIEYSNAQLESANLGGAHLTGSSMPSADLRETNLSGAALAEIEWERADLRKANLRGATFHLGSARSGLVGSPIACEGSKTGFYTDDFEDMNFKRPEDVRKANLRGADLRGAVLTNVDFYLVDLREAQLDPPAREHARQCGAILADVVA